MTPARERVLGVMEDFADAVFIERIGRFRRGIDIGDQRIGQTGRGVRGGSSARHAISPLDPDFASKDLTDVQADAAAQLVARVQQRAYSTTLLRGVTGQAKPKCI